MYLGIGILVRELSENRGDRGGRGLLLGPSPLPVFAAPARVGTTDRAKRAHILCSRFRLFFFHSAGLGFRLGFGFH